MSAYFTQHHPPRWTFPHRFTPSHEAGTTTAIPSLVPSSQAAISPAASDQSKAQQSTADQQQQHHALGLDTLTRFLHAFHTHYGTTDDRSGDGGSSGRIHPRFDLAESKACYAIYADLAGLGREDVTVEVNDQAFTLTISGMLKRPVPEVGQSEDPSNVDIVHRNMSPGATASPPNGKGKEVDTSSVVANDAGAAASAERVVDEDEDRVETKTKDRGIHWHVTERQVGQFRRGFMFPPDVAEITAVEASMTNGLLCVVVPKKRGKSLETKPEPRKVQVL
ncbi:hypothetical protein B0T19DRAFT_446319 [Cercophora scortea]|uniref:SHSP domain-containing protein n=1 Tax=Cercophora scortea TaxID=314031 RepID=A0AAE0I2P8_9PEZI|nr:hypothetical protein B0T19DRAFT_446319 [Cercophora scortea]